jgi:pimeloyl-ACP methyl ester carboxylesterase
VSQLVLVDAAGYPMVSQSAPLGFRLARMPGIRSLLEYILPRGIVQGSVRDVYGDPSKVSAALVDQYMDMALREGNRKALVIRLGQPLSGNEEIIKTLKLPTLIVWGGRDRLIPLVNGQRFAADIAGSSLVVLDELGHVPQEEDPQRSLEPVKHFLSIP